MANQPQQPDTALHNASHLMQYHDLIESIVAALDARDAYTASHSDRVADMVLVLAAALGLDEDETTASTWPPTCTTSARSPCRIPSCARPGR